MNSLVSPQDFNPDDYWEKRLTKKKGLVGVGYTRLGSYFNFWAYKVRKHVFKKQFFSLGIKAKGASVLDVGSGSGFYIRTWKEVGAANITGVDLTKVAVEDLKKEFPCERFFQCDIGDENYDRQNKLSQYDFVSCMDVLFHIVDDKRFDQAIKNISSLVKPGGYFIYSDNFIQGKELRALHQASRSSEYLHRIFAEHGFEIVKRKPFMYLTNTPVDSNNILLKMNWFIIEQLVSRVKLLGAIAGLLLYPFEIALVDNKKEGPSTEIVF